MSANASRQDSELYEFGPFRVDPQKETLFRSDEPIPLTPKTFQVLLVLVRHSQEVVTKDDLMKAVWPDTFVEEANLSRNIFMLRRALGEDSQEHRYIVTVPGRGYRLAENVHLVPGQDLGIIAAKHSKVQIQVEESRNWRWMIVAAILLLVIGAGAFRVFSRRRLVVLSGNDTLVLADFSNSTGDAVFDGTLRQGLAVQLEQSPFLSLIPEQRIQHTLRLMGRAPDAPFTPELAREICMRTGGAAVLEGSIASLGSRYVLGLRAKSCKTGDVIDDELVQAERKEEVLDALTQIASKFRARVGESMPTIEQHDTPLAEATTQSLEALEAYSTAWKVHYSNGAAAALPLFKRATEIDPEFALAHASLGRILADLDESDLSAESISRAWQLKDRISDPEIFFITTNYEMLVTGNLEKARQTCEAWTQTYPREALPHSFLSGYISKAAGQYEKAAAEARKAVDLNPDFAIAYYSLGVNNAYLGRLDEAENALQRATRRGLEIDEFIMLEYDMAFLKSDETAMECVAARARERNAAESWISAREGFALAFSGHLKEARNKSRRAVDQAQQAGQKERAGLWEVGAAVQEALFGNASEARKRAIAALQLSRDREVEYGSAFALALARDSGRAQALTQDLERRFPEDSAVRFSYLPTIQARLALNRGDSVRAVELLQVAAPNELGVQRSSIHALFGALYPVYVRGEAYLAAGQGAEAVAEFQKILDHRGIVMSDVIGALAHLQIGRAYAKVGDTTKAESAYRDFFTLWKDADADIPILRQARNEYAKLQ